MAACTNISRSTQTDLALIGKRTAHAGGHAFGEVRVGKDDVGVLATELKGELLVERRRRANDVLSCFGASCERQRAYMRVLHKCLACERARAKDKICWILVGVAMKATEQRTANARRSRLP